MTLSLHRHLSSLEQEISADYIYQNIRVYTITHQEFAKIWNDGKKWIKLEKVIGF